MPQDGPGRSAVRDKAQGAAFLPGLGPAVFDLGGEADGALLTAFVITLLELTEVVAIVYALGATAHSLRPGLTGACGGVAVVGAFGIVAGIALTQVPQAYTLAVGAVILWSFGFFLLRSTFRTYVREERKRLGRPSPVAEPDDRGLSPRQLMGVGFSVGAIEALEAVVVLIGISVGGFPWEAVVGAIVAGGVLVALGLALHQNIRKLKVPPLKWATTSLLMTYASFWTLEFLGEEGRIPWPSSVAGLPPDVLLIPIFFAVLLVVRVVIEVRLHIERGRNLGPPSGANPI